MKTFAFPLWLFERHLQKRSVFYLERLMALFTSQNEFTKIYWRNHFQEYAKKWIFSQTFLIKLMWNHSESISQIFWNNVIVRVEFRNFHSKVHTALLLKNSTTDLTKKRKIACSEFLSLWKIFREFNIFPINKSFHST